MQKTVRELGEMVENGELNFNQLTQLNQYKGITYNDLTPDIPEIRNVLVSEILTKNSWKTILNKILENGVDLNKPVWDPFYVSKDGWPNSEPDPVLVYPYKVYTLNKSHGYDLSRELIIEYAKVGQTEIYSRHSVFKATGDTFNTKEEALKAREERGREFYGIHFLTSSKIA